ncbi:MAG: OmpA family protein [Deltaproteobacteria bacterium]|nr:OmpA family protein [Nannocystaceae bacterium]
MAEILIKRERLTAPGPAITSLSTQVSHRIVIAWHRLAQLIEFDDALFRTNSAVVLPSKEGPSAVDDAGRRRTTVGIAATVLRHCEEHPERTVLVAGHADTAGNDTYNRTLSEWRAQCVHAVLVGDAVTFANICNDPRRMRVADYEQILTWLAETRGWDCDPGQIDDVHTQRTQTAVNNFRKAYNAEGPGAVWAPRIQEYGAPNTDETWIAYFNCYEEALAAELGVALGELAGLRANLRFVGATVVGCGENHPIEAENVDAYRSQTNRRVEVVFFDPDELPELACHASGPGSCDPAACDLYDRERYRRRVLPPMLSALPWRAQWSDAFAHEDEAREMLLEAPGLPAGTEMHVTVSLRGHGPIAELVAIADADGLRVPFDEWFVPAAVTPVGELEAGEPFPEALYDFAVEGAGRKLASTLPIRCLDRVHVRVVTSGEQPLADTPYTLVSPWGQRRGRTDADGVLDERQLPPGGASIVVRDRTLLHLGELQFDFHGDES